MKRSQEVAHLRCQLSSWGDGGSCQQKNTVNLAAVLLCWKQENGQMKGSHFRRVVPETRHRHPARCWMRRAFGSHIFILYCKRICLIHWKTAHSFAGRWCLRFIDVYLGWRVACLVRSHRKATVAQIAKRFNAGWIDRCLNNGFLCVECLDLDRPDAETCP